jgi:hypothetical protein
MDFSVYLGNLVEIWTASERTYRGILAFLDPRTLTVTLMDACSGGESFDMISIRATDIIGYEFIQSAVREPTKKQYKKKISAK